MASQTITSNFYKHIISKVCEVLKDDFQHEGIADDVLLEFKRVILPKYNVNKVLAK